MRTRFVVLTVVLCGFTLRADEGMWLYDQFPRDQVAKKYGFEVTGEFLNHLRLASLKMGASASFVSPDGLIFTNHHVAAGCIQKLSTAAHNYTADGFYAKTEAEELKCPDTEANVLARMEDVTKQVNAAVKAPAATPKANQQRRAAIAGIEKDCSARSGNRCEVVTLYSGALYMSTSTSDTPTYAWFSRPRRRSRSSAEIRTTSPTRASTWTSALCAHTRTASRRIRPIILMEPRRRQGWRTRVRLRQPGLHRPLYHSSPSLSILRDTAYPLVIDYLKSVIDALDSYSAASAENKRVAEDKLFSAQNSYKARIWEEKGLKDPKLLAEKKQSRRETPRRYRQESGRET